MSSSLLALDVPVPVGRLCFERLFSGDTDRLLRLSALRRTMQSALAALDSGSGDARAALEAVRAYSTRWASVVGDLERQGTRATTRQPLSVEWRWRARQYASASLDSETMALRVAETVAAQRAGDIDGARATIAATMLELERAPVHPSSFGARPRRASPLESPVRWRSMVAALDAQRWAHAAIDAATRNEPATVAAHFFTSAASFRRALELTPTDAPLRRSLDRVAALAHRYVAEALVDCGGGAHENGGVAVALARQALAMDPSNERTRAYATELERRNSIEFGMQSVPPTHSITFRRGEEATPRVDVDWSDAKRPVIIVHL